MVVGIFLATLIFYTNSYAIKNEVIVTPINFFDLYLPSLRSPLVYPGDFSYEEKLLYQYSLQYKINYYLAWRIINCESGWKQYAANNKSSADSYWQFLDSTWKSTMIRMELSSDINKFELPYSIQAGAWLLSHDGSRHWYQSQKCWKI